MKRSIDIEHPPSPPPEAVLTRDKILFDRVPLAPRKRHAPAPTTSRLVCQCVFPLDCLFPDESSWTAAQRTTPVLRLRPRPSSNPFRDEQLCQQEGCRSRMIFRPVVADADDDNDEDSDRASTPSRDNLKQKRGGNGMPPP
jgi:hypothetical protein